MMWIILRTDIQPHIHIMYAYTTENFLTSKLCNMKAVLLDKHGASSDQLDQLEARIRREESITAFACKLNDGRDVGSVADRLVRFCDIPENRQVGARQCILAYLVCFAEATWSISSPH